MQQKTVGSAHNLQQGSTPIRVFLISGHRILLWGLQQLIKSNEPAIQLAGIATSYAEARAAVAAASPDVILLDLDLPDVHPQDISAFVSGCSARVLVMTGRDDQSLHDKAVLDGARGVLTSQASPESFLDAIAKVHEGQLWLDRAATGRIFVELSRRQTGQAADKESSRISTFTEREKKIVACIFENSGDTARTIADKLHISESTLRNHLTSIYGKLGISNRFELISYALKHGPTLSL
jgi:DNA-binding NarL/FixJ family response regulator